MLALHKNTVRKKKRHTGLLPSALCAGLGAALFRLYWSLKEMDVGMLLFYMNVPKTTVTNYSVVVNTTLDCLLYALVAALGVLALQYWLRRTREFAVYQHGAQAAPRRPRRSCVFRFRAYKRIVAIFCAVMLTSGLVNLAYAVELPQYLAAADETTTLYDEAYIDPAAQDFQFPETKRNLVHIVLESMETTCADPAHGGQWAENLIPNLTALAEENASFSGFQSLCGTDWTIGALVAQTSGLPLNTTMDLGGNADAVGFLPGAWTLGDILAEAGYRQMFLCGSDGGFAGRSVYYQQHGGAAVWDYNTAIETGRIPADYYEFWGFEDAKLYTYAKEQLLDMAAGDAPFHLTLLTVDTHFYDGYVCTKCGHSHDSQYENVIACADSQVRDFLDWLQAQDFYENTTVVITGDHLCMDNTFYAIRGAGRDSRRIYNCYLNTAGVADDCQSARDCSSLDVFPTTLSAMGVRWGGTGLGLGVDLFSGAETLVERLGLETLDAELNKRSAYYQTHFLLEPAD